MLARNSNYGAWCLYNIAKNKHTHTRTTHHTTTFNYRFFIVIVPKPKSTIEIALRSGSLDLALGEIKEAEITQGRFQGK